MVGPTSFSARGILSTAVLAGQACAAAGNVILLQASDGDGSAASGNRTAAPGVAVVAKEEEDGNLLTVPIALGLFLVLCFFCGAIMFCAYKRTKVRREALPWTRTTRSPLCRASPLLTSSPCASLPRCYPMVC